MKNTEELRIADERRKSEIYRTTIVGAIANIILFVLKFAAGILGRSSAMLADAVHSLSDLITDFIVLVFVRISSKPQDRKHEYGHGKYETLATTIIGTFLLCVGLGIMWESGAKIWQFANGQTLEQPGVLAFWAAIVSIAVKELLFHYTRRTGERNNSKAVIANAWHHRSDALSSIGTALGIGGAVLMGEKWAVLDPLAALAVSFLIIHAAIGQVIPSLGELLEDSLPEETKQEITNAILSVRGVSDPHNMHTRKIGNRCAIDVHVRMDGNISLNKAHEMTTEVEHRIKDVTGRDSFVMVHVEPVK